jgi:hypothetical protein
VATQAPSANLPVLWEPQSGFQSRFCAKSAFEVLGGGSAGPGKTSCLIALAAQYAQHPNARVLFLRTVYKDLLDVRDRMQALYPLIGATWSGTDSRWIFPSGAPLMLAHGASMAEIGPFLGPEYSAVLWDELSLVPSEAVWQMLLSRIRSTDPTVPLRARASANPVGPGKEWLRERFVVPCGATGERTFKDPETGRTRAYVPGTSKDNRFLPASYWQGLKDLPESIRVALQEGRWDSPLGMFYPGWAASAEVEDRLVRRVDLRALPEVPESRHQIVGPDGIQGPLKDGGEFRVLDRELRAGLNPSVHRCRILHGPTVADSCVICKNIALCGSDSPCRSSRSRFCRACQRTPCSVARSPGSPDPLLGVGGIRSPVWWSGRRRKD